MGTIIENFEKTEDGLPPPQAMPPTVSPSVTLRFPSLAVYSRADVAYFAPQSVGTFLPGNLISVPVSRHDYPSFGGGVLFTLKEAATGITLDFWIAGLGYPGHEGMRIEYFGEVDLEPLAEVVLQTRHESYHGTVESPPVSEKVKYIRVTSPSHENAVGHFVLTTDGALASPPNGSQGVRATVRETFDWSTNIAVPTANNPTYFGDDWVDAGFRHLRVSSFGSQHLYGLVDSGPLPGYAIGVQGLASFVLATPASSVAFDYYISRSVIPNDDAMHVSYLDADGAVIGEVKIPSIVGAINSGTLRSDPSWNRRIKAVEVRTPPGGGSYVANFELVG